MDEEQPKKKITLNNFFEQIVEIDKVANMALSNSNMVQSQLNTIQLDLKRLIESLQVNFDSGVQNVQTQINEVTNVIVQEQEIKKSETDALEEQIFAQEDKLQKQVKGKKATSSDGNLMQKAMSSVKDKAGSNLLAAGLFGGSLLLAGLKPPRTKKAYEKNRERSKYRRYDRNEEVKSDNNFFTNFFDKIRNFDGTPGSRETKDTRSKEISFEEKFLDKGINDTDIFKDEKPLKEKVNKISTDNITNNIVNNNVVEEIVKEKKRAFVPSNVEFKEHGEVKDFNEETRQLKNLRKYNPKDVILAAVKSYNEGGTGIAGFNEETGKIEVTSKEELQAHKEAVLSTKAGVQPDGGYSTYAANTVYSQFMGFDDGPVSNNVIDGGTTIIQGDNEVVNEDIGGGQGRGEVVADVSIVKSSNSPVSAVAIAEGNSLNNLTI